MSVIQKGYIDNKNNKVIKKRTLDKRNPPPLTMGCAPSGDEGPTVYIQTKEKTNKTKTTCSMCR
jgi:hypothetical protein